ncbi:MAG: SDR family NAD(P)-dependent oxidoreductase [Pirellulales bacterium]
MARRTLNGLRALVTGASSGIGREIALELVRNGVDLVLVARRAQALRTLVAEVQELGRRAVPIAGDVTDAAVRRQALDAAREQLGGLDLLVNNAGVSAHGRFAEGGPEVLRQIMEVNFFAPAEMIRDAVPLLLDGQTPMVVNVSSILGRRGIPLNAEYCASKFALTGFSEALRAELAGEGIDVLVVSPGTTETELFDSLLEEREKPAWAKSRGVTPEYVARATVKAIRRGKHEIVPNWQGWGLLLANRIAPRVVDRVMKRLGRRD